ncbi:site-specific integrase [Niallia sp. FSL W8-0951]|uniref:site-specific integrase n=1 Tax=Niallia sp. FSL W8-0951 TaxID=2954639 RepID=UPI0030F631D4
MITGLRVGELCALTWDRVDLEKKVIHISKTVYNPNNNKNETLLVPPKNKSSIRFVDIDDHLIRLLKEHKVKQNKHKMELRKDYIDNGFVFAKEFGEAEIVKKIETRMNLLLRIADLDPSFSPHTLRHTHTTMLREKRVEFEYIQARLGHAKGSHVTNSTYIHQTEQQKKEATAKINSLSESFII